ncbi:MAG: NUDIX domain-containing protein [Candidatus Taylorbacteria bacterium]
MGTNLQVGVKILLKNKENKFLLLRRSPEIYDSNKWDIPGGRINPGSTLMENLKREVEEETKMQIIGAPKLVSVQDILKKDMHVTRVTYIGRASGDPVLSKEHVEYKWATLDEMKKLDDLDSYVRKLIEEKAFT